MKPTITTEVTVTSVTELAPEVAVGLKAELDAYMEKREQVRRLEAEMEEHKKVVEVTRALIGEKAIHTSGYLIRLVEPLQARLDKGALMRVGVSVAQIEAGTITKPAKPYLTISRSRLSDDGDDQC